MINFTRANRSGLYILSLFTLVFFLTSCPGSKDPEPAPVAEFEVQITQAPGGIFTINNSENADEFFWDFGDGTTSDDVEPSHTYGANGNYKIKLRAKGAGGEDSYSQTVTISNVQTNGGGGGGGNTIGRVAFYTGQAAGWTSIEITVDGSFVGTISGLFFSGMPNCEANGTVTVRKSPGTYSYSAKSNTGVTWSGNVTITANGCLAQRLDFPSTGSQSTGKISFWGKKHSSWTSIDISVEGKYIGTITGLDNEPACGGNGMLTITMPYRSAPYTYTCKDNTDGHTWSGGTDIPINSCRSIRLGPAGF